MTETRPTAHIPPETLAALISTALRAQRNGDTAAARTLLRVLAVRQPDEPRVWLALATVAESRDEQRRALERVIALDPAHPLARRGLARFAVPAVVEPPLAPAVLFEPSAEAESEPEPVRDIRWPGYAVLLIAAAVLVLALLLLRPWEQQRATSTASDAAATPLAAVLPAPQSDAPLSPTEAAPAADVPLPAATAPLLTSQVDITSAANMPAAPPTSAPPALAPGTIVTYGDWHASLLRPEHAVLLDGSIGAVQPRGRFVLALVTLGNDGAAPARIPASLFSVVDARGNRYQPQAGASSAYLAAYGRGQRGDLSMEDAIPGGGGNVSVPVIFDVPVDVRGLTLQVGATPQGWTLGGG